MTTPTIRRLLTRADLILFGLVILTPTAPYPVYGIIQKVSQGHAALSYLVALVAMLFTAGSYAKMATAFPSAGSTYTYVQQAMAPSIGFLAGWAMILDYFLIPLVSIVYAAITMTRIVPQCPYSVWAILFAVGIALINARGIRLMAHTNTALMIIMTVCALLFIALCVRFVVLYSGGVGVLFSIRQFVRPETLSVRPVMLGAAIATLSYIGFDAISTLAEDTVNAKRDIGFSTIIVCLLQAAICTATVYLASLVWSDYQSFSDPDTAILDLGKQIGGVLMFHLLTFVLLVAGLASALTGQAGASRLLFAMGRDRVISQRIFSHLDARYNSPTRAIWAVSATSIIGALLLHFQILVELLNFGAFVGFVLVNLSVIQHYYFRLNQRRGRLIVYNLLFPLCGALVCSYVWLSLGAEAKIVGFSWLAIGAIYAFVLARLSPSNSNALNFRGLSKSSEL